MLLLHLTMLSHQDLNCSKEGGGGGLVATYFPLGLMVSFLRIFMCMPCSNDVKRIALLSLNYDCLLS